VNRVRKFLSWIGRGFNKQLSSAAAIKKDVRKALGMTQPTKPSKQAIKVALAA